MQFEEIIQNIISTLMAYAPKIASIALALIVGWIAGRLLGAGVTAFIRKIKIDETFKDSVLGRALERFGMSISAFIGAVVKWAIYTLAILVAINILGIGVLNVFTASLVNYLPNLVGGVLVSIFGMIIIEVIVRVFDEMMRELRVPYPLIISSFTRLMLYLIVIMMALSVMKVDVSILYSFATALFWGISVGLCVGLGIAFGWGLKDYIAKNASKFFESTLTMTQQIEGELKLKEYEKRVKELEDTVKQQESIIKELTTKKEVSFKELERIVDDLDKRLSDIVRDTGSIKFSCGTYKIEVLDPSRFPWTEVIITLTNNGFKVLLERINEKYIIEGRPYIGK